MSEEIQKETGTLIKVISTKRDKINASKDNNTKYDAVFLFYRDKDGKKITKFIDRAELPYYIIKDKSSHEAENPPMFIKKELVDRFESPSDQLLRDIATATECKDYFDKLLGDNQGGHKNLHRHNWVYGSDMDISDRYIERFHNEFEPDEGYTLKKSYFDIEVDLMPGGPEKKNPDGTVGYMGFPDEEIAPCPICLITFIDGSNLNVHTFILDNKINESLQDFKKNQEEFKVYLKNKIKDDDKTEIGNVNFYFIENELEMIIEFFRLVHEEVDPDFACAWNAGFDCTTLLKRVKKLVPQENKRRLSMGLDRLPSAEVLISDQRLLTQENGYGDEVFIQPRCYFRADKGKPIVDRTESFTILDSINWFDQLGLYASIRKSSGQKESYSLNAIAEEELKKEKLPFEPGETMKNLPWKKFSKYVEYNIRDVLLLYLLENKNLDLDMLQRLSEITNTRKEKVFKKTISLKNFVAKYAEMNGFIMGNNKNAKYGTDEAQELFNSKFLNQKPINESDPVYRDAFFKKENYGA